MSEDPLMYPPKPTTSPHDLACAEFSDELEAYALGALDHDELPPVEAHLQQCPSCRAIVGRYERVIDRLTAIPSVAPPPQLRETVLAAVAERSPAQPVPATVSHGVIPAWLRVWQGSPVMLSRRKAAGYGLVAAGLILALVVSGMLFAQVQQERDAAQSAQAELADYLQAVGYYTRDGGVIAPMVPVSTTSATSVTGRLMIAPDQSGGMVMVAGLPETNHDERYGVWVQRGDARVNVGDLWLTAEGFGWLQVKAPEPLTTYDAIGIMQIMPDGKEHHDLLVAPIPATGADHISAQRAPHPFGTVVGRE